MKDLAKRFPNNPIFLPKDITPSDPGLQVICLLNPGVFRFGGKIWLLLRVADSIARKEGFIFFPVMDELEKLEVIQMPLNDPDLVATDAGVMTYLGLDYLARFRICARCQVPTGFTLPSRMAFMGILPRGHFVLLGKLCQWIWNEFPRGQIQLVKVKGLRGVAGMENFPLFLKYPKAPFALEAVMEYD